MLQHAPMSDGSYMLHKVRVGRVICSALYDRKGSLCSASYRSAYAPCGSAMASLPSTWRGVWSDLQCIGRRYAPSLVHRETANAVYRIAGPMAEYTSRSLTADTLPLMRLSTDRKATQNRIIALRQRIGR